MKKINMQHGIGWNLIGFEIKNTNLVIGRMRLVFDAEIFNKIGMIQEI